MRNYSENVLVMEQFFFFFKISFFLRNRSFAYRYFIVSRIWKKRYFVSTLDVNAERRLFIHLSRIEAGLSYIWTMDK